MGQDVSEFEKPKGMNFRIDRSFSDLSQGIASSNAEQRMVETQDTYSILSTRLEHSTVWRLVGSIGEDSREMRTKFKV